MSYINMKECLVIVAIVHFIATCWAYHIFTERVKKAIDDATGMILLKIKPPDPALTVNPVIPFESLPAPAITAEKKDA